MTECSFGGGSRTYIASDSERRSGNFNQHGYHKDWMASSRNIVARKWDQKQIDDMQSKLVSKFGKAQNVYTLEALKDRQNFLPSLIQKVQEITVRIINLQSHFFCLATSITSLKQIPVFTIKRDVWLTTVTDLEKEYAQLENDVGVLNAGFDAYDAKYSLSEAFNSDYQSQSEEMQNAKKFCDSMQEIINKLAMSRLAITALKSEVSPVRQCNCSIL